MSSDTWDSTEQVLQLRRSPRLRGLVDDPALEPWTDDATLRRYLRAREGNISKASKMLQASLEWRRSESPQTTTCSKCAAQPLSHNMRVVGFDEERRPVLYVSFGQAWDRFEPSFNVKHLQQCLESTEDLMRRRAAAAEADPARVAPLNERWVWIVDFEGYALRDNNPRSMILTAHLLDRYPERLHKVIMYGAPWIFNSVWRVVRRVLNEETASKVCFTRAVAPGATLPDAFDELELGSELAAWLREECADNRRALTGAGTGATATAIAGGAKRYWEAFDASGNRKAHDSRGVKSYVESVWYVSQVLPEHHRYRECQGAAGQVQPRIGNSRLEKPGLQLQRPMEIDSDPISSRYVHTAAFSLACLAAMPVEGLPPWATVFYEMICVSVVGLLTVSVAARRSASHANRSAA